MNAVDRRDRTRPWWRRGGVLGALVAGCIAMSLAAGCGSSDSNSDGGGAASTSASSSDVAQAQKAVEDATKEVTGGVPTSSPPIAKNKSVVLIPASAALEGASEPMAGAKEAAELLGWKTRTIDGKGTPADEAAAITQAVALKPDAIIIHAIDPSTVKGAINAARAARIPVIASSVKPTNLVDFSSSPTQETWEKTGEDVGNFIVAETNGKAKYIQLDNKEFAVVGYRTTGLERALSKCGGCKKVASASFSYAEMASKLPQLVQQLLQAHPEADAISVPFDAAVPFVLQGQKAIGKKLIITAGDGTSEGLKCIRDGCGLTATGALPVTWIGWTDVDAANRIFNGEDPNEASVGLPAKLVVKDNVQQEPGTWNGDVDYPTEYKKLWKVNG
jgi:ribose transport system substrate-binding protein